MATHHPNPLGHISIGVRNYEASKAFYTAVLETIGLRLVYDSEAKRPDSGPTTSDSAEGDSAAPDPAPAEKKRTRTLGFGVEEGRELLNVFEFGDDAAPPGPGFHLAFNAPTRESVVEFYALALGFGGSDNGLPGVRKHYGDRYFAAFVVDPDGWRLEVVCKT
ncbi:Glyoxalase/Bleomycin resistance protein/Dihydroxybiphenyl dioxygenase [Lasiosphaeria ovina]|uniref:Glyoxalase/Bleomycin resistance protein/Dihydroxybiphenyl dioxygenase n=1 Tax=Lasiosphaeria ovina TaxID=92902 RepID=A0AAE0JTS3_9PEZI|nr:Glyoxalase/Bleomycin resistance protein/Dihydroxybiphenyl dioxygenase [Lasiosphaeria ovina]